MACSSVPAQWSGSALSTSEANRLAASRRPGSVSLRLRGSVRPVARGVSALMALVAPAMPLLLAAALCLVALAVVPERPQDQETICQRHNGVEACRVW